MRVKMNRNTKILGGVFLALLLAGTVAYTTLGGASTPSGDPNRALTASDKDMITKFVHTPAVTSMGSACAKDMILVDPSTSSGMAADPSEVAMMQADCTSALNAWRDPAPAQLAYLAPVAAYTTAVKTWIADGAMN